VRYPSCREETQTGIHRRERWNIHCCWPSCCWQCLRNTGAGTEDDGIAAEWWLSSLYKDIPLRSRGNSKQWISCYQVVQRAMCVLQMYPSTRVLCFSSGLSGSTESLSLHRIANDHAGHWVWRVVALLTALLSLLRFCRMHCVLSLLMLGSLLKEQEVCSLEVMYGARVW
jgi:hypothetical protein